MNRKRLISILAGLTLSMATFAGPAAALEGVTVEDDTVEAELADTTVTLEADEDPSLEASTDEDSVSLDPTGDDPVETTLDDDEGDTVDQTIDEAGDLLEEDPAAAEDDGPTSNDDGDVKTADGDGTRAAATPQNEGPAFDASALDAQAAHRYGSAYQQPTPAAVADTGDTAEPAPVVAPPRDEETVDLAASTPISDPASPPFALKVFASLLVAGTAMTWWNAREAVGIQAND
ncbi:MAG: hypothetical protein R3343_10320 [Nitriliruptorales bacterium]|nr:hypothetical protein [Nitriliruptorales bacterium]